MKNRVTILCFFLTVIISLNGFSQTAYRSIISGVWSDFNVWERTTNVYNPSPTWAPAISGQVPTSNNIVYVRSGHTVTTDGTKSSLNLIVEAGGTLSPGANTLRVGVPSSALGGGSIDTLRADGTLGGPGSTFALELGAGCSSLWIMGSGTIEVGRIRPNNANVNYPGSATINASTGARILIDKDILLDVSGNYALSALNSGPTVNDSISLTIFPSRTVTVTNAGSYFHNDLSTGVGGNYVYNINGTLDLSINPSITGGTKLIPFTNAASSITLNVGGLLKLGGYFKADTIGTSLGSLFLNINNGGVIDASLTSKLITGTIGAATATPNIFFKISGNGSLIRTVPADGTKTEFNIGTSLTSYSPVTINGNGPAEVFTVTVKDGITNPDPGTSLQKEWSITEQTPGGNATDTLRFGIPYTPPAPPIPGDFNPLAPVYALRWNGSAWEGFLATITGGTSESDPYVAKVSGFAAYGLFILSNTPPTTTPVVFVNVKAYQKQNGVQVEFGNATESDVVNYVVEKSIDGRLFSSAGSTILPKSNNGGLSSYTYFDATPNKGNNFYRIKVTERNGNVKYSSTLNIRLQTNGIWVNAYPNPVRGSNVNVQLENFDKAVYTISVYNQMGQRVYSKNINHTGGTATFAIDLPVSVKKGVYNLQVSNTVTTVNNKIVVE